MGNSEDWVDHIKKDRVAGILVRNGEILLIHRFCEGKEYWVFPGGSVEEGESIQEALEREMNEELSIVVGETSQIFEVEHLGRIEHHFLITKYTGEPKLGGPEKERMNETNQYILTWVALEKISQLQEFYPHEGREIIISLYNQKRI